MSRWPTVVPAGIATFATHAVLAVEIVLVDVAVLMNTRTDVVVVDDRLIITEIESMTAPSLELQLTSKTQPAPFGVLKSVAVVRAAVPPTVANECKGRSISIGLLFVLLLLKASLRC